MPLTEKGQEIKAEMTKEYGEKRGEEVLYASKNAGKITGIDENPESPDVPVITSPPLKITAAEVNEQNRRYWYQQKANG